MLINMLSTDAGLKTLSPLNIGILIKNLRKRLDKKSISKIGNKTIHCCFEFTLIVYKIEQICLIKLIKYRLGLKFKS